MGGPICIFDSGVGGLTVLQKIRREMPDESLVYFGDTARAPYGGKDAKTLISHGREIINFFLKHDAKMIIMACGTSSSTSYDTLCAEFPSLPIVDTIRPAAEETLRQAQADNFRPLFIATQATINSGLFSRLFSDESGTELHARACPLFAPLVEAGHIGGHPTAVFAAKNYLADLRGKVNTVILGCTHYPLLKLAITQALGEITFIDPAEATARAAAAKNLPPPTAPPKISYYTSGAPEKFSSLARIILNENIAPKKLASL
ncbi:MAG: glutamate racemase [Defluviitaleaceae bacterium]|nr:glutamate racemase [Defluviitaleaceae bacterium]